MKPRDRPTNVAAASSNVARFTGADEAVAQGVASLPMVVVSHPGRQHAHEVVLAAQRARMLQRFVTGFYWRDRNPFTALASRTGLERYLRGRWNHEIDPALVASF